MQSEDMQLGQLREAIQNDVDQAKEIFEEILNSNHERDWYDLKCVVVNVQRGRGLLFKKEREMAEREKRRNERE